VRGSQARTVLLRTESNGTITIVSPATSITIKAESLGANDHRVIPLIGSPLLTSAALACRSSEAG
jgi:hypothetical protein